MSNQKEFNYLHYQQIEVRGIVVFVDENTNALGMRSASILYDMSEVRDLILPLFKSLKESQLRLLRTHYQVDEFIKELKRVGSLSTILEHLESSFIAKDDSVVGGRSRSHQEINVEDDAKYIKGGSGSRSSTKTGKRLVKIKQKIKD